MRKGKLYSVTGAAKEVGYARHKFAKMVKTGKVVAEKVGWNYVITEAEVKRQKAIKEAMENAN